MKKNSLTRKIAFLLTLKLFILIGLWKLFFSEPLSKEARKEGIQQNFFSVPGDK